MAPGSPLTMFVLMLLLVLMLVLMLLLLPGAGLWPEWRQARALS